MHISFNTWRSAWGRMVASALLLFVLLLIALRPSAPVARPPEAVRGIMDLGAWRLGDAPPVALSGEWRYYPGRMIGPEAFNGGRAPAGAEWIRIPAPLNQPSGGLGRDPARPFGTYVLELAGVPAPALYGLKRINLLADVRIFVGDELLYERRRAPLRDYPNERNSAFFRLDKAPERLILQVLDVDRERGATLDAFLLGTERQIQGSRERQLAMDLFMFGSILLMGLYHLGLYVSRRKDPSTFFFGLFCSIIAVRVLFTNEYYILTLVPELSWRVVNRVEYLTYYLALPAFVRFLRALFPREVPRWAAHVVLGVSLLASAVVVLAPFGVYERTLHPFDYFTVAAAVFVVAAIVRAAFRRREGAIAALVAFLILFATALNDILLSIEAIQSRYMVHFGLLAFIFTQSFLLANRFARAFATVEELSERLLVLDRLKDELLAATTRFVPNQLMRLLNKDSIVDVRLGDQIQRRMTVLFSDIRSFTTLSEQMTPQENFNFINSYLGQMGPIIREHDGFIDKYIGDAIMALFDRSPDGAIAAGVAMLRKLEGYNEGRRKAGYAPIAIGIGINTGELMLGTIGERDRMEGTVISDAVNLASRVEGLTKEYAASLLITDETLRHLEHPERIAVRFLDRVKVKGKSEPVMVYEVIDGDSLPLRQGKLRLRDRFERAVALYQEGRFDEAQALFAHCVEEVPEDGAARAYQERCRLRLSRV
ncbi:MAG TPA: 7TM diverse intracellular signaling domain-containing protein [Pantanalinema sp.]